MDRPGLDASAVLTLTSRVNVNIAVLKITHMDAKLPYLRNLFDHCAALANPRLSGTQFRRRPSGRPNCAAAKGQVGRACGPPCAGGGCGAISYVNTRSSRPRERRFRPARGK